MRDGLDETIVFPKKKKKKYQNCMNQITLREVKVAHAVLN